MGIFEDRSSKEETRRESLLEFYKQCPIPEKELLSNLGLFISKTEFSRMLYIHELYKNILDVHGIVMEFGVRWGQNIALFETFHGIYEPFNRNRKIIGFDTFTGFPSTSEKDGTSDIVTVGSYGVTKDYQAYLEELLIVRKKKV